jgi:hypothetical protein
MCEKLPAYWRGLLSRLALGLDQGFDAYLLSYRERSAGERRDFNSMKSLVKWCG